MSGHVPPKRILVPVDFTPESQVPVAYAVALAQRVDATIVLVHVAVFDPGWTEVLPPDASPATLEEARERRLGTAAERLRQHGAALGGVPHESLVVEGDAVEAIVSLAREQACDLIVVGSHGRRGLKRALLGSVAERVVRHAPVPVLVARWEGGDEGED